MRYNSDHKEQTKQKIVETASREFRLHGFDGIGISALMTKLKLTHGGFYAHFEDKEDLIAQALAWSTDEFASHVAEVLETDGVAGLVKLYLSEDHLKNPHFGCPLPALSLDVSRHPDLLQAQFGEKLERTVNLIAVSVPGKNEGERHARAWFLVGSLAGAISMARAVADSAQRTMIVDAAKDQLLKAVYEDGI